LFSGTPAIRTTSPDRRFWKRVRSARLGEKGIETVSRPTLLTSIVNRPFCWSIWRTVPWSVCTLPPVVPDAAEPWTGRSTWTRSV
jgi:hypothetical protein